MAEYERAQTVSTNLFPNCFKQFDKISDSGVHEKPNIVLRCLVAVLLASVQSNHLFSKV